MGRCDYDLFMDCPTVVQCCLQLFSLKTSECKLATIFRLMRINVILLDYSHVLFIFCYKNRLLWGQTAQVAQQGEKMEFVVFCLLLVGLKFTLYRYTKSAEEVVSTLL